MLRGRERKRQSFEVEGNKDRGRPKTRVNLGLGVNCASTKSVQPSHTLAPMLDSTAQVLTFNSFPVHESLSTSANSASSQLYLVNNVSLLSEEIFLTQLGLN